MSGFCPEKEEHLVLAEGAATSARSSKKLKRNSGESDERQACTDFEGKPPQNKEPAPEGAMSKLATKYLQSTDGAVEQPEINTAVPSETEIQSSESPNEPLCNL